MSNAIKDSFVEVNSKKFKIVDGTVAFCSKCNENVPICIKKPIWLKILSIFFLFGIFGCIIGTIISKTNIYINDSSIYINDSSFTGCIAGVVIFTIFSISSLILYYCWPLLAAKKFKNFWLCPHCFLPIGKNIDYAQKRDEREIKKTEKMSFAQSYGNKLGEQKAINDINHYINNESQLTYNQANSDIASKLKEIENLRNNNYISEQEYENLKKEILKNLTTK